MVRQNSLRAAGGSAGAVAATERSRARAILPTLPLHDFPVGQVHLPSTALSPLVAAIGAADPEFIVTSADGNEASGVRGINDAMKIRHPVRDDLYSQGPDGGVFEPISEDACAGLASGSALMGGRSLWFSYESFAINGLPVWQTVTQAMAELRRGTPSAIAMFTAGALEQGRNGWTHQRPEIEAYLMALTRNGNVHPLFPMTQIRCGPVTLGRSQLRIRASLLLDPNLRCPFASFSNKAELPSFTEPRFCRSQLQSLTQNLSSSRQWAT